MSPMPRNPFRGGVRSIARALASCALAASVAAGGSALGAAAVLGAGALALGPQQAWAEPVPVGDFMIEGDTSKYSYVDGVLTVMDGADIVISMADGVATPTSDRIVVAENAEATITLNGVSIKGASRTDEAHPVSAIDVKDNASLLLRLAKGSTNTLAGGSDNISSNGVAGIHVPGEAELTILGSGSLTVTGGDSYSGFAGNGIGGNTPPGFEAKGEDCGTVVILATGKLNISGGKEGYQFGKDIGGGKSSPNKAGDDGGGVRPTGDGNYVVWGEPTLPNPPSSYAIPAGTTLTVPGDAALCIPPGVTLINNGTITGGGNLNGDGVLAGSGVVTVGTNNFQKDSALTLTIEGATTVGGITSTVYGSTITLKAKVEQENIRVLSAGDYNTVTFYVGTGDSKKELGTAGVENNEASLTNVKITAENGWGIDENTITAVFSGHSHLKPATGTATLVVVKAGQTDVPSAPTVSKASPITDTSVTLETMSGGIGGVEYGCTTDSSDQTLYKWQDSPTFENLIPATAYTFYARYAGNEFYLASASSNTGLEVITAPAADAVTIDYEEETLAFDDDVLEVNSNKEFSNTPLSNNGTVASCIGRKIYVRVKSGNDANAPIRGIVEIDVPVRPASPEDPKVVNASAAGRQDGKILNLTPNADYQISTDETTWVNRTTDADGVISNLAAGAYKVRTKATPIQFAGASASVTINVGDAIAIIPPTFEPVYVGYDQPDPMRFTILNTSDQDVTLTSLSKTAGETFTIQHIGDPNFVIPAGGSNTSFTVQPGEGWGVGEHTATITVEYGNGQLATAEVTFTVLPRMGVAGEDEGDSEKNESLKPALPATGDPVSTLGIGIVALIASGLLAAGIRLSSKQG